MERRCRGKRRHCGSPRLFVALWLADRYWNVVDYNFPHGVVFFLLRGTRILARNQQLICRNPAFDMISMVGRDCGINRKTNASAAHSSAASITEIAPSAPPASKRRRCRSRLEAQAAPSLHTLSKTKRVFSRRPAQSAAVKQRIRLYDARSDSAFAAGPCAARRTPAADAVAFAPTPTLVRACRGCASCGCQSPKGSSAGRDKSRPQNKRRLRRGHNRSGAEKRNWAQSECDYNTATH